MTYSALYLKGEWVEILHIKQWFYNCDIPSNNFSNCPFFFFYRKHSIQKSLGTITQYKSFQYQLIHILTKTHHTGSISIQTTHQNKPSYNVTWTQDPVLFTLCINVKTLQEVNNIIKGNPLNHLSIHLKIIKLIFPFPSLMRSQS